MNMREVPSYYVSIANDTTLGLRNGFLIFKHTSFQQTRQNSFAKQGPRRSGLNLFHEPHVKILLFDIKMMVSPMRLTVPFTTSNQLSLSSNLRQLKNERLENQLRFCGDFLASLEISSLMEMTKVHSSSQLSMLAHMSSGVKIEETELENWFSNLLLLEVDKHSPFYT